MMSKTIVYQHCHCVGYKRLHNLTQFFCYKVLSDRTRKEFIIYNTQIDMIVYGAYDMGYIENTYIRVNGEYQCYDNFDSDFNRFIGSSDKTQYEILESLTTRYPNANITIFEDGALKVWLNRIVDVGRG